jgi:putative PIN family toxin of toxin-antitoxin system
MRILCDTNVLVRSIISPFGSAAELLRLVASGHSLIVSLHVLNELYDVLRRPQIRKYHRLSDQRIRRVISRLYKLSTVVTLPPTLPSIVPHDSKDNPIVMSAIAGQAELICTLDRHLHAEAVTSLCASHAIRVLRDADLLAELRALAH